MEEILASIRRIIADDDASKTPKAPEPPPAPKPLPPVAAVPRPAPPPPPAPPRAAPPPPPPPPPRPAPVANNQDDIDAMLADLDAPPKVAPKPAPPPPVVAAPPPDVFDLTEAMAAPPPPSAPSFRTIDGAADVVFSDRTPEPAVRPPEEPRPQPSPDHALISSATIAAVDSAFNSLAHTVLGNNARTLEDLVKEMLRPMLKSWLDDNLPNMVERIVRAEIERVSRGRP
jgi:cell pole-organizing protein PopZ